MSCVYYVCQTCGRNSLLEKICPQCETTMDMEYDERYFGGPDCLPLEDDGDKLADDESQEDIDERS